MGDVFVVGASNSAIQVTDALFNPVTGLVTVDTTGQSSGTNATAIAPADEYAMQLALDNLRPQTTVITTTMGPSTTARQTPSTIFSGSSYLEVLRYVTGTSHVAWPPVDALHWIEPGVEREAPRPAGDLAHHYTCFHNLSSVISYIDNALTDANYETPQNLTTPLWVAYYATQVGPFNSAQQALYPFLQQFTDTNQQFSASDAAANTPEILAITDTVNGTGVINSTYPKDYLSLPGVDLNLGTLYTRFWASQERAGGADYLEIDLGVAQAVNFIYFEATRKPLVIDVAYDVLDMSPKRHFVTAEIASTETAPSITSLTYDASATSPWQPVEIHCVNALNQTIFTRFVRIGFTRTPGRSPLAPSGGEVIPYSVEVRNLRIGRNIG